MTAESVTIPADLLPADGRFGCGPSKVRPEQLRAVADAVDAAPAGGEVVVFATYTAMWHLHPRMERMAAG